MSTDPYTNAPNPTPPQSGGSKAPIIIIVVVVVLMFSIAICGILAAIAIPAFLRYTKKSKAAEAQMVLNMMANEVDMYVMEHCAFPEPLPPHADIAACSGGAKCLPNDPLPQAWQNVYALKDPSYFVYSATPEEGGLVLRAQADFDVSSELVHTEELRIDLTECTTSRGSIFVTNEFE